MRAEQPAISPGCRVNFRDRVGALRSRWVILCPVDQIEGPRWVQRIRRGLVVVALSFPLCWTGCSGQEHPRTYLVRGYSGTTQYSVWVEGSTTCLALNLSANNHRQVCQPGTVFAPGEVGLGSTGSVVFGLTKMQAAAKVRISGSGGEVTVLSVTPSRTLGGWSYFVGGGPPTGIQSFQLLDRFGNALETPQTAPFGSSPEVIFIPETGVQ